MKKIFSLRVLLIAFLAGILIAGVGCGISFFEFQGMTYAGEKVINADAYVEKEESLTLPDNDMTIFYPEYMIQPLADDEVPAGSAVITYSAPESFRARVDFDEPSYIYSYDTGHISPHRYNFLTAYVTDQGSGLEAFKTFMYDIRDRKLYTYVTPDITLTLRVNPLDYERFEVLEDSYGRLYDIPVEIRQYGDNIYYYPDMDEYFTYDENGEYSRIYPMYDEEYTY